MLTDHVERYVALRRATGFKVQSSERMLRNFAQFATARGESHIRSETAVAWAGQASSKRQRHVQHMLALTTYMRHACVESTYWYLERTPALLRDIAGACQAFVAGGEA